MPYLGIKVLCVEKPLRADCLSAFSCSPGMPVCVQVGGLAMYVGNCEAYCSSQAQLSHSPWTNRTC